MAVTLDGQSLDLPKDWSNLVLKESFQESVVGRLTNQEPVSTNGNVIPVYDSGFEVGHTAEASPKPVSDVNIVPNFLTPNKYAGILLISKEAARANPANMLDTVRQDMINAVARQVDYGVIYGRSAKTGSVVSGTPFINQTTNRVALDLNTDLVPQFLAGYDLAGLDEDPDGFAFDSQFRTKVALASQQQLAPAGGTSPMPNLNNSVASFAGLPTSFGRTVSGRLSGKKDSGVKGFVGDWDKLRWGFSENISITRSTEGTVVDGNGKTWSLFQDNMIGLLVEFEAGWWADPTAFAAYELEYDAWVATTAYALGDRVTLSGGEVLEAIVAGTSGSGSPTAPAAYGGTVTDGTVEWIRVR